MSITRSSVISRASSLFDWDSRVGLAIDIFFGFLPALALIFASLGGLLSFVKFGLLALPIMGVSLMGMISCGALIYVTVARENTENRKVVRGLLMMGVFLSCVLIVALLPIFTFNYFVFPLVVLSLVALKHIITLSRATPEVHP